MQTILGCNGAIGQEVQRQLVKYTDSVRLVSRNPKKIIESYELFAADLIDRKQVFSAIKGSEIVYLLVGLEYNIKIWEEQWPKLMRNVIDACKEFGSKLVFFDNVYAIGGDNVKHITEESPISPTSKKGVVRASIDKMVLEEIDKGTLNAIIARSPDFFGPIIETSALMNVVYNNLIKGKKAQWLCNAKVLHSMGFTFDLGLGTALLGNTPDAYNQIWNLPTDKPIKGEQWIKMFAEEMNTSEKYQTLPSWLMKILGLFVPILKEMYEMSYQNDRDYYFDSTKFEKYFNYTPTSNKEAVRQTIEILNKQKNK
jgi:nucleoside-diphosphate-sugar epimerase